ncbi:bifunctional riboflavin kinase/FAD synthetase [Bacteroides sp. 224]|uniref:bifunctional riboflavin kinase/FAD synthetase n=1 Tax=Bacteroides sp. 224 TaxID=2302936 RepID=UPI0013D000C0|nr:bifunctional riboflavin kinase/FAD synthetase [Bacteroides sp. 224]NDV63755.1 bifunctional riboflavin kinase/FAD synthetase [Bacteroides sp. 224]
MKIVHNRPTVLPGPCAATIGFFDGVHTGHRFLIEQVKASAQAKGLCSAVITFPVHPRKVMNTYFKPDLLTSYNEKVALLAETGIDYCFVLDFTGETSRLTAFEFMQTVLKEQYNIQTLVIGHDHRFGHNRSETFDDYCEFGRLLGIDVVRAQACTVNDSVASSSVVRRFLHEGNVKEAAHCLGYPYFLNGTVIGGYKVGRTIGYPTANLRLENQEKLIPADGVYAVRVEVNGTTYKGMLNIGYRPTFQTNSGRSIEVHILDFDSDIYNSLIRLSFIEHIRSEMKFNSKEELIAQLDEDAKRVREI